MKESSRTPSQTVIKTTGHEGGHEPWGSILPRGNVCIIKYMIFPPFSFILVFSRFSFILNCVLLGVETTVVVGDILFKVGM
ncbi:hypothetical protein H5410_041423 [Solanum commersonii]|uniref:Transmembrane protein n=1 Tax=Solanum commersonii TaxID=4109 RepID=A0A9J5XSW7_SOLCO|nr:hypothetical protein H5410_041423 [Solanum commersonii]